MTVSEAQIRANQINAVLAAGTPRPEVKDPSPANAPKRDLTVTTIIPDREAAEVERRYIAFCEEMQPSGEIGMALARQAAMMSVRTERCFEYENAKLAERVRLAEANFVAPGGVDDAEFARLRQQAGRLALFDPSPEATLARKYEAAAQRCFFRALKELRQHEKAAKAAEPYDLDAELGSFSQTGATTEMFEELYAKLTGKAQPSAPQTAAPIDFDALRGRVDVPFSIGKRR